MTKRDTSHGHVAASEWSVSVTTMAGRPAVLNVSRYGGARQTPGARGDHDGKTFANSDEAWKFAQEHGYVRPYQPSRQLRELRLAHAKKFRLMHCKPASGIGCFTVHCASAHEYAGDGARFFLAGREVTRIISRIQQFAEGTPVRTNAAFVARCGESMRSSGVVGDAFAVGNLYYGVEVHRHDGTKQMYNVENLEVCEPSKLELAK